MSLVKCPECGKQISSQATSCPQCGYPISEAVINDDTKAICPKCNAVFSADKGKIRKIKVGQVGSWWWNGSSTPIYEKRLVCPKCAGWW